MELRRVNDIIAEYPGEWVAVEVMEYDPTYPDWDNDCGALVAHSKDKEEVLDAIDWDPESMFAFAYSGPQVEPGYALTL